MLVRLRSLPQEVGTKQVAGIVITLFSGDLEAFHRLELILLSSFSILVANS